MIESSNADGVDGNFAKNGTAQKPSKRFGVRGGAEFQEV